MESANRSHRFKYIVQHARSNILNPWLRRHTEAPTGGEISGRDSRTTKLTLMRDNEWASAKPAIEPPTMITLNSELCL